MAHWKTIGKYTPKDGTHYNCKVTIELVRVVSALATGRALPARDYPSRHTRRQRNADVLYLFGSHCGYRLTIYDNAEAGIKIERAPVGEARREKPLIQRITKSMATGFSKWGKRVLKLLLCLVAVGSLAFLSWAIYYLLQHEENPLWGSDSVWYVVAVIGGLAVLIGSAKFIRSYRYRRTAPSFKLAFISLLLIVMVLAFAGIEPLHGYKDRLTSAAGDKWEQWQADRELAGQQRIAEQEREVNNLINEERAKRGLPPATWSDQMHRLARDQSDQMAQQKRLFHSSRYALEGGENAWGGEGSHSWTPEDIVNSWMGSSPHRAWILDPRVRIAGVGISHSDDGMYAAWAFSR